MTDGSSSVSACVCVCVCVATGCQYISLKSKSNARVVSLMERLEQSGDVAEWCGSGVGPRFVEVNAQSGLLIPTDDTDGSGKRRRMVGVGGMNRVCKALLAGSAMPGGGGRDDVAIDTRFGARVRKFEFDETNSKWLLHVSTRTARTVAGAGVQSAQTNKDDAIEGPFDGLIASDKLLASDAVTRLFGDAWPLSYVRGVSSELDSMITEMRTTQSTPSFVLMLELSKPIRPIGGSDVGASDTFDGAVVHDSDTIAWIAKDSSKPGRDVSGATGERWVIQSTGGFAADQLGADGGGAVAPYDTINKMLFDEFVAVMTNSYGELNIASGSDMIVSRSVHRWGAAFPTVSSKPPGALFDTDLMVASCGDWSMIPNIEGAVVSGIDAGEKLADALISRNKL